MSALFQQVRDRALELGIPFALHLDVTYRCNERCVHCYLDHDDHGEMSLEEIRSTLDQAADLGTFILTLSGGEPFYRRDFFDILEHARKRSFAVKIKTNGLLIGAEQAARLRRLAVHEVQISLYSHREEVHDALTKVRGSHARSIEAIRLLRAERINVVIASPMMRANIGDYTGIRALAAELDAPCTMDPTITPMIDGDRGVLQHRINPEQLQQLFTDSDLVGDVKEFCRPPAPADDEVLGSIPCSAGHTSVYVSPYGDVYPCVQFPITCGNVRRQPFTEIWSQSPEMLKVRNIRLRDLHTCSGCSNVSACSRCPGLAFMEGDMLGPSSVDCEKSQVRNSIRTQAAALDLVQISPIAAL